VVLVEGGWLGAFDCELMTDDGRTESSSHEVGSFEYRTTTSALLAFPEWE